VDSTGKKYIKKVIDTKEPNKYYIFRRWNRPNQKLSTPSLTKTINSFLKETLEKHYTTQVLERVL